MPVKEMIILDTLFNLKKKDGILTPKSIFYNKVLEI